MAKTIKYCKVKKLSERDFKRVVGVKKETFEDMVKVVRKHYRDNKTKGGTKKTFSVSECERPKKSKKDTTQEKRKSIPKRHK